MEKEDERVCRSQAVSLSNGPLYSTCKFKIFVQEVHGRSTVNVVSGVTVRIILVCRHETMV
jgi:hypothetical protein